jgi:hypothetical protein
MRDALARQQMAQEAALARERMSQEAGVEQGRLGLGYAQLGQSAQEFQQRFGLEQERFGAQTALEQQQLQQAGLFEQNKNVLAREQLAQQAQEAAQRNAVAYSQIQNQRAIAEMETAARSQALAQQNLMKQQELEMQKAYQHELLGLREQELQRQQQMTDMQIQEATRKLGQQEKYDAEVRRIRMEDPTLPWDQIHAMATVNAGLFPYATGALQAVNRQPLAVPSEYVSPQTGVIYTQFEEGGPYRETYAPPSGREPTDTREKELRTQANRRLESLLEQEDKALSRYKSIATQVESGNRRAYEDLGPGGKAEVDGILELRKNIKAAQDKLNQLYGGVTNAYLPAGAGGGTNAPRVTNIYYRP